MVATFHRVDQGSLRKVAREVVVLKKELCPGTDALFICKVFGFESYDYIPCSPIISSLHSSSFHPPALSAPAAPSSIMLLSKHIV